MGIQTLLFMLKLHASSFPAELFLMQYSIYVDFFFPGIRFICEEGKRKGVRARVSYEGRERKRKKASKQARKRERERQTDRRD